MKFSAHEIRQGDGVHSKFPFAHDPGILSFDIQIDTPLARTQQKIGILKSQIKPASKGKTKLMNRQEIWDLFFSEVGYGGVNGFVNKLEEEGEKQSWVSKVGSPAAPGVLS